MMNDVETNAGLASIGLLQASFSPEQRDRIAIIERVKARVLWTDRDTQVTSAFNDLLGELVMRVDPERLLGPGNRREAKALVVLGKTGAGKTSLLSRAFSAHPAFPGYNVPRSGCSLVTVSVPSPCNLKSLGIEVLACLGYPLAREMSIPLIWRKVAERLELLGVLVLHLDEIHNVLEAVNARELRDVRKTFKTLLASPRWPVMLVVSGLPEVQGFFEGLDVDDDDDGEKSHRAKADTKGETRRRARFIELPSLALPHDIDMIPFPSAARPPGNDTVVRAVSIGMETALFFAVPHFLTVNRIHFAEKML